MFGVSVTAWPATDGLVDELTVVVDEADAVFTVSAPVPELPAKLPSPEYDAERPGLPAANPLVVSAAVPAVKGTVPSGVLPSKNCTAPPGAPAPAITDTVAVSVTAWLKPDGFGDATSAVAVAAGGARGGPGAGRV